MNTSKATGLDNLPAKCINDSARITSKILRHIVNLAIHNGKFPKDLKSARVVPLYKKDKNPVK